MANAPKFKLGDRVRIVGDPPRFGVVEYVGKRVSRGLVYGGQRAYVVRYEGGYICNGRDCPQKLSECHLSLAEPKAVRRG